MPTQSALVVIFNDDKTNIVLHKREDFRIWALPGGGVEPGESFPEAAIREAYEETGYRIAIDRLVGEYWRPQTGKDGDLTNLFAAHVVGGEAIQRGTETLAVAWFPVNDLPKRIYRIQAYIQDAARVAEPIKKTIRVSRQEALITGFLINLRNLRNRLTGRP